eukprot:459583-Lingulodinium_polyedra.AAC.1
MELWPLVREELRTMRDLVPVMAADMGAPLAPLLFAADARGGGGRDAGGFGAVYTHAEQEELFGILEQGGCLAYTVPREDGDLSGLKRPEGPLVRTVPRTQLPDRLFDAERWCPLDKGKWASEDHINLGECRTVVRVARRLASQACWHRHVVVVLEDNQ